MFSRAITFSPRHSASPVISVTEAHSMVTCTSVLLTRCFYFLKPQSFRSDMPQSDKPQSFRSDQPGLVASRRASRWRSQNPSHRMKPLSSDETPRPPEGYFHMKDTLALPSCNLQACSESSLSHGGYGGHWVSCIRFGEKACEKKTL